MDLQTSGDLLQGYPAHRAPVGHLLDLDDYTAGGRFIVVHGSAVSPDVWQASIDSAHS
jgi:hypothetical protein